MDSLGACLLANDIPYTGMAKDIFQRRVDGKSWKEIADEFNVGTPGSARKLFTKLTGITDYKIKGEALLDLAKGGLDPKLFAPKISKKLKFGDDLTKKQIEGKINVPNKLGLDGEDLVIKRWHEGVGQYTKLSQESGLSLAEVDQVVWREAVKAADGDVWKAHKIKETSEEGIKAVRSQVFELRSNGYTVAQVADHTGIPQATVEQILGGGWKPSPFAQALPGHPEYKPVIGRGTRPASKFGSSDFPLLTDAEMRSLWSKPLGSAERDAIYNYTGSGYLRVNSALRSGGSGSSGIIEAMDRAMYATAQPVTVTRGMSLDGFGMGHIGDGSFESIRDSLIGTVFEDKGFLSTSISPGGVFHNTVRLVIEVPPGAKGYYAQSISAHKSELEFILARNTKIMVTSVEQLPNGTYLVRGRVVIGA